MIPREYLTLGGEEGLPFIACLKLVLGMIGRGTASGATWWVIFGQGADEFPVGCSEKFKKTKAAFPSAPLETADFPTVAGLTPKPGQQNGPHGAAHQQGPQ
jgi:hypothetical protein